MIPFRLKELSESAQGSLCGGDLVINAVATDSRKTAGALFIALRGERFDGHDFLDKAIAGGAVALGVSKEPDNQVMELCHQRHISVLRCDDTLRLLGLAGRMVRNKSKALVVSLTGSCGKTTVKELTALILSQKGRTLATPGNFNNDVGVPLTLLNLEQDTEFAVIEQGASHPLDIARTCEFVGSSVALINNAGSAHIEGFGSLRGVYLGKSEILQDVFSRGGTGIVPSDSDWIDDWKSDFSQELRQGRLLTFGSSDDDFVTVKDIRTTLDGVSCKIKAQGYEFSVELPLLGAHNAMNAAAACALALKAGADVSMLKDGLLSYRPMAGRLCVKKYSGYTLIDDAYNASFNSVIAALDVLAQCEGRRVFIFGDMGELGSEAGRLHEKVGLHARHCADELWCLGRLSEHTCRAFGAGAVHFASHEELITKARKLASSGIHASFLVKGSHAMHMDLINNALIESGETL